MADERNGPYGIGSPVWPGLAKLLEEACEAGQILSKIIARGGDLNHTWTCAECGGTGKDPTIVALNKLAAVMPERCSECNGKGVLGSGDLTPRLHEELGDLHAALDFFILTNPEVDPDVVYERRAEKFATYTRWHAERTVAP